MFWSAIETPEGNVNHAITMVACMPGARLDGLSTAEGWELWYRVEGEKPRRVIRTRSFERYAKTVARAIAARRIPISRKPPANAPSASNGKMQVVKER
jgi:hypothetical protein